MYFLKLLWVGAAYLASREVVTFLKDQAKVPAALPEGTQSTADGEADDADDTTIVREPESTAEDHEAELRASDHTLMYTVAGLAAATFGVWFAPLRFLSIPLIVVGMVPPAKEAWQESRKQGKLTYAGLEVIEATTELALGHVVLTAGGWLLYSGSRRVLLSTRREAREELLASVTESAAEAWVLIDDVEVLMPLDKIGLGDLVVVHAGQSIPLDGRVVSGVIGVDQQALTGETGLTELSQGGQALAGTTVISGEAVISAERTGEETVQARVEFLLANATSFEQQLTERVTRVTERSVRPTLALAGYGLLTRGPIGIVGGLWTNALDIAWMSAPYAMFNTLRAAAKAGVLIKDGRSLELLSTIDTVVFDKTGTLTMVQLEVSGVFLGAACEIDVKTLLRLAAAIEQYQSHPIAEAIVQATRDDPEPLPNTEGGRTEVGYGVRGRAGGHDLAIGSARLFALDGIDIPPEGAAAQERAGMTGHSIIHIAVDGVYAGSIEFAPQLRPDAVEVVNALRERGLKIIILSGDDEGPTRLLAEKLGVETYVARALPEDKTAYIEALQAEGRKVCFVGDGINDALAMHSANVSVSLAYATSMAIESAQVILNPGELSQLLVLFRLGADFSGDQDLIMKSAVTATAINSFGFIFVGFSVATLVSIYGAAVGVNLIAAGRPRMRRYVDARAATEPSARSSASPGEARRALAPEASEAHAEPS